MRRCGAPDIEQAQTALRWALLLWNAGRERFRQRERAFAGHQATLARTEARGLCLYVATILGDLWDDVRSGDPKERQRRYPLAGPGQEKSFYHGLPALLGTHVWCRPDARAVEQPSYSENADPHVLPGGTGVASVLQKLQLLRDGRFEAVEAGVCKLIPFVKRLRGRACAGEAARDSRPHPRTR